MIYLWMYQLKFTRIGTWSRSVLFKGTSCINPRAPNPIHTDRHQGSKMALSIARKHFVGLSRVVLSRSTGCLSSKLGQNVPSRNASYMDVDDTVAGLTDDQKQVKKRRLKLLLWNWKSESKLISDLCNFIDHYWAMYWDRSVTLNKEQGSYCFYCKVNWMQK